MSETLNHIYFGNTRSSLRKHIIFHVMKTIFRKKPNKVICDPLQNKLFVLQTCSSLATIALACMLKRLLDTCSFGMFSRI